MTTVTLSVTTTSRPVLGNGGGGGGAIPPSNTVAPVISGSSDIGSVLSTTDGTWSGTIPITYTYQWKRNGVSILGATASTYTLVAADYNLPITCEVTATNIAGSASATSNSITCTGVTPANTVAPVISGTPTVGQTLSVADGTWTGTAPITYTYQWKRNGSDILGATSSTYALVQADATFSITCVVTGTNVVGSANATSNSFAIFDADAQAFISAASITDNTQKNAVNNLVVNLKAASIWTKMKAIYPFVGGTATTHKWNLKNPLDTDAAFRLVFSGGWTHSSTGATPNGVNAYADTFLVPNTAYTVATDAHMSFYSRTNVNLNSIEIGTYDGSQAFQMSFWNNAFSNQTRTVINNAINLGSVDTNSLGFLIANRSGTTVKNFKNSSIIASGTNSVTAKTTTKIWIGAQNFSNSLNLPSSRQSAFASIGDGLTDTEALVFNQIVEGYQYALSRNVNPVNANYYNPAYNNETNAFLYASEITNNTQKSAVNTLVNDLKAAGVWTKMKAVYPFVGGTASTHKWNLKDPQDTNAAFRLVFNGGWTHSSTGALPNGTNAYANTYLTTSAIGLNSGHISFYSRSNLSPAASIEIGALKLAPDSYSDVIINYTSVGMLGRFNATAFVSALNSDSRGFYITNRTAFNVIKFHKNSTIAINSSINSQTTSNVSIFIGAANNHGVGTTDVADYYSAKQCAFTSIGNGLTDTEAANFYTAVQAYQTTLGRQV